MNLNDYFLFVSNDLKYDDNEIIVNESVKEIVTQSLTNPRLIFNQRNTDDFDLGISLYMVYGFLFWDKQRYLHMTGDAECRDKFFRKFISLVKSIPTKYKKLEKLHPWYIKVNTSTMAHDCPRNLENSHVYGVNHTTVIFNHTTTSKNPKATKKLYNMFNPGQYIIAHQDKSYDNEFLEVVDIESYNKL